MRGPRRYARRTNAENAKKEDEPGVAAAAVARRVRYLRRGIAAVALLAVAALLAAGWTYSTELLTPVESAPPVYDTAVRAVDDGTVTLARTPASARPGVWGLAWPDGYARVGRVTAADDDTVTRVLTPVQGRLRAGQHVLLDWYAYPTDPDAAFDFPVQEVPIDTELGTFPAWLAKGDGETWVIAVHGRGGNRAQHFRLIPTLHDLGFPVLAITYRNDPEAPASPDGWYGLGSTEWEEVEAAAEYALAAGARRLVLVGSSMGGAIVAAYLHSSATADAVVAAVLDAPVLDWDLALQAAAADRGLPTWLTPVTKAVVTLRTGLRWSDLDVIARADELDVPILLVHGTDDAVVPVRGSDAFARARPDLVTYERVEGAGHVESWNTAPRRYEAALRAFLVPYAGEAVRPRPRPGARWSPRRRAHRGGPAGTSRAGSRRRRSGAPCRCRRPRATC